MQIISNSPSSCITEFVKECGASKTCNAMESGACCLVLENSCLILIVLVVHCKDVGVLWYQYYLDLLMGRYICILHHILCEVPAFIV